MVKISSVAALESNYIHIAVHSGRAVVVDPGEALPALNFLERGGLTLEAVLLTHRHSDHIAGVAEVLSAHAGVGEGVGVVAPENTWAGAKVVAEGEVVSFFGGALELRAIATPGHTLEHMSFYGGGVVFCGDALFGCGCGRVFEGTMGQMRESLAKFRDLPGETLAYCGHEMTEANVLFARAADPDNKLVAPAGSGGEGAAVGGAGDGSVQLGRGVCDESVFALGRAGDYIRSAAARTGGRNAG